MHHAASTNSAAPGKESASTGRPARKRVPFSPVARTRTIHGAKITPTATIAATISDRVARIAPATMPASSSSFSASSPGIHRDERRRQDSLSEQILQHVRNTDRDDPRIRDVAHCRAEVFPAKHLAHDPEDAGDENADGDERRAAEDFLFGCLTGSRDPFNPRQRSDRACSVAFSSIASCSALP